MYWDGERWLPGDGTPTVEPKRPELPRRARDWASTAVMAIALIALIVPIHGAVATDEASGPQPSAYLARPETVVIQESDRQVKYSRGWESASHDLYLGGQARQTKTEDARATLRFTGAWISWVGPAGPAGGTAMVLIDGRRVATIKTWAPTLEPSAILFETSWDAIGAHRIAIVVDETGGQATIGIDAFLVGAQPGGSPDPTTPPDPTIAPAPTPGTTPTLDPTAEPTLGPPVDPTANPTPQPPSDPTPDPTPRPTAPPTSDPTPTPTPRPTASPTPRPTPTPTPRPTATPAPTQAPTPPPPPPDSRPFAAPNTSDTYTVPSSIDASGDTDVYRELNDWIDDVPNGSIISFPAGGTYKMSQGIKLGNRSNLIIRGNGSVIRLTGSATNHQASAFVVGWSYRLGYWTGGNSHITIRGFTVVGNDPTPGTFGGGENQQAVRCNGSTYIEITDMTVRAVYGDGAFLDNCNDVWVHNTHVVSAGRNGLTVVRGQRVLGEANAYDKVGYATFDIEPNHASESSIDITFRNNVAGTWQSGIGFVSVDGAGRGADIRRVIIDNNRTTGMPIQIYVDNKDGVNGDSGGRMRNITVTDNVGPGTGVLRFRNIDNLWVLRNDGSETVIDCTSVVRD